MLMATNGPAPALAVIVQRARHQLLAGAGLAVDHHRQVGGREPGDGAVDLLHRRAAADQRQASSSDGSAGLAWAASETGCFSARPTTASSSCRSKGLGRYSKAPRWVALHRGDQRAIARSSRPPRRSGRMRRMRGIRSSPFSSGITTSVMTRSPSPSSTQRHSVAALPVAAHLVAGAAQRLGQHGADRAVVVGDQNGRQGHDFVQVLSFGSSYTGRCRRNSVRPGRLSTSISPPWSPTILATSARPRPAAGGLGGDEGLEQMRADILGDAGPVVAHGDHKRQVERAVAPGDGREPHAMLEAGGEVDLADPAGRRRSIASAAFFTRLSTTWISWSRLPQHRRQRRIVGLD